jgi:hypothetical protein
MYKVVVTKNKFVIKGTMEEICTILEHISKTNISVRDYINSFKALNN